MKHLRLLMLAGAVLVGLLANVVFAQTEVPPATTPIVYGSKVEGDLTGSAFWDWWTVQAMAGDRMVIEMTGQDGLAPLLGILDPNGTLVTRSDDGDPNGVVDITYTAPSTGRYTIVTTRVGNANGMTVGHYVLRLGHDNPSAPQPTALPDVTFQCGSAEATSAISLRFPTNTQADAKLIQQIIVVGVDGFDPAVRVESDQADVQPICAASTPGVDGDQVNFPGEARLYVSDMKFARATLAPSASPQTARILIGSAGGATGRYLAILTNFSLEPASRQFPFEVRLGPRAAPGADALVYMLAADGSRVDPTVTNGDETVRCDDAGKRDCAGLRPVMNAGIVSADLRLTGHRFDAGLLIARGSTQPQVAVMTSFQARTGGLFNVMVVGELTGS